MYQQGRLKPTTLTKIVRRVLDFIFLLSLTAVLILPIIVVIMAISQSQSSTWGIDIGVFSEFMIDTSNLYAWYLFVIVSELSALISMFVVIQFRAIVMSFEKGMSFTQDNSQRIKKIGAVVII